MIIKKLLNKKINSFAAIFIIVIISLFCAFKMSMASAEKKVFAGKAFYYASMAECTQYEFDICNALCPQCGCGPHDELDIAPIFGGDQGVKQNTYICKSPSYTIPNTTFDAVFGTIIFGSCPSEELSAWNPECNVWGKLQL